MKKLVRVTNSTLFKVYDYGFTGDLSQEPQFKVETYQNQSGMGRAYSANGEEWNYEIGLKMNCPLAIDLMNDNNINSSVNFQGHIFIIEWMEMTVDGEGKDKTQKAKQTFIFNACQSYTKETPTQEGNAKVGWGKFKINLKALSNVIYE